MRTTRSQEKKRKQDEGIVEPPKEKRQTLGQYLDGVRAEEAENILQTNPLVDSYETLRNYDKASVISEFNAHLVEGGSHFGDGFYECEDGLKIIFLTMQTGDHPKTFSHICGNSCLKWNLASEYRVPTSDFHFGIPAVYLVFIRGEHVQGTTKKSKEYKCLGLMGFGSMSSSQGFYLSATLLFDYVISRKEMEAHFGDNVMKCKKNKYGCTLCA